METSRNDTTMTTFVSASRAREFEIDLFWKRALFFWGFLAAAFVALVSTHGKAPHLAVLIACFGTICSWTWTLANRGSKYWYESWEAKAQREASPEIRDMFARIEPVKNPEQRWSARRYSVSRLAIALSDFTTALWACVLAYEVTLLWTPAPRAELANAAVTAIAIASLAYAREIDICCRKHADPRNPDA